MSQIATYYKERQKIHTAKRGLNLRFFNAILFLVVFGLGFAYLISVSDLTVKGFVLQELRAEVAALAEERLSYKEKIDALQSYYVLSERAKSLDMVAISDIEYIQAGSHIVAKK